MQDIMARGAVDDRQEVIQAAGLRVGEFGHDEDVPGGGAVQGAHHAALPLW